MSIYVVLTPATACRALREAGFPHPAEALRIDAREVAAGRPHSMVPRLESRRNASRSRAPRPLPPRESLLIPSAGNAVRLEFRL